MLIKSALLSGTLDAIIAPTSGPAHRTDLRWEDRDTGGRVSVQRHPLDVQSIASLLKFRGAVATANGFQAAIQRAICRHLPQEGFNVGAKLNHGQTASVLQRGGDDLVGPVNVLRL